MENSQIDFNIDKNNLYREESLTDLKIGAIRSLTPVKSDGTSDDSRETIYIGNTQLMSPQGPVPIQARLKAATLDEAIDVFPETMKQAMEQMIEEVAGPLPADGGHLAKDIYGNLPALGWDKLTRTFLGT